jgi:hypothetical protein
MAGTPAATLGAKRASELRQDAQTAFRALIQKLMRPKGDQAP